MKTVTELNFQSLKNVGKNLNIIWIATDQESSKLGDKRKGTQECGINVPMLLVFIHKFHH